MDKEALKKRIFAEGEKAKGGVNRFLEEEKQELSHEPERQVEQPQAILQNSEKAGLPLKREKPEGADFLRQQRKKQRHLSKKPPLMQRKEA